MFDANGTEGLELFTWIVACLIGLVAALVLTHTLTVTREDNTTEEIEDENHKETVV